MVAWYGRFESASSPGDNEVSSDGGPGGGESAFGRLGRRELVDQMHAQLDEMLAARDQMEQLLGLILEIGSDLQLDVTLTRIVTAAKHLTHAPFGALALRRPDGTLTSFVHDGINRDVATQIGHLPVGKGLLGVILEPGSVLRLDDIAKHPDALGFPPHHPDMRAFLGVPIVIRGRVFGSLYLAHDEPGRTFDRADEDAARVLASAAAVAIDNAQLFERVQAGSRWTEAAREITTALLSSGESVDDPLRLIAEKAKELTDAEQAIVLVPAGDLADDDLETLVVSTAVGIYADQVVGQQVPVNGSTSGQVFRSGEPMITETFRHPIQAFTDVGQRPAIVMPLRAEDEVRGVIVVARNAEQPPFDSGYLDLVGDFAQHAAIALALAAARERDEELTLLADRERIARDLHDQVIQQLFATGLDLQGTISRSHSPEITERLTRTVDDLQSSIETIRASIFALHRLPSGTTDFRQRINQLVADLTDDRDFATTVKLSGPLTTVTDRQADQAAAVLTEAISNVARHAGASRLTVAVHVNDELVLDVIDDGCGIPPTNQRSSGLANMARRAETLGGTCDITSPPEGGTRVRWAVPMG